MADLSEIVMDFVLDRGASKAGIATVRTLEGGPPSTDLTYVLPHAKSAISYAVPIDQKLIRPFFMKKDYKALEHATYMAYTLSSGISLELATYLEMKGFPSASLVSNRHYRLEAPHSSFDMLPNISHRYLAVRSGVGHFGLSGNVILKEGGAAVVLGSVVTTAELNPTDPLPESENYCDECGLCMAACSSGFMDKNEKTRVTMGGVDFSYAKRRAYMRCGYVCGGLTGLHKSGKWSTWSPGRFPIPEKDEDIMAAFIKANEPYNQWPPIEGGHYHFLIDAKIRTTCAHCQFICSPDKEERRQRYELLTQSGVVMQTPEGPLKAVSPDEAKRRFEAMAPERRALYEEVS